MPGAVDVRDDASSRRVRPVARIVLGSGACVACALALVWIGLSLLVWAPQYPRPLSQSIALTAIGMPGGVALVVGSTLTLQFAGGQSSEALRRAGYWLLPATGCAAAWIAI